MAELHHEWEGIMKEGNTLQNHENVYSKTMKPLINCEKYTIKLMKIHEKHYKTMKA